MASDAERIATLEQRVAALEKLLADMAKKPKPTVLGIPSKSPLRRG